jgi:MFS family permease
VSGLSAPRGGLTAATAKRRFLVLTALRWLPSGLVIPLIVLLPLDRGLSIAQLGLAAATQGLVVFALELPTGGLADAVGRRPVLIVSMLLAIASLGLRRRVHPRAGRTALPAGLAKVPCGQCTRPALDRRWRNSLGERGSASS